MIYALKWQTWNLTKLSGEIERDTEEEGLQSESQSNDMENEPDRMDVTDENGSEEGNWIENIFLIIIQNIAIIIVNSIYMYFFLKNCISGNKNTTSAGPSMNTSIKGNDDKNDKQEDNPSEEGKQIKNDF